jgi:hypothetical protein
VACASHRGTSQVEVRRTATVRASHLSPRWRTGADHRRRASLSAVGLIGEGPVLGADQCALSHARRSAALPG